MLFKDSEYMPAMVRELVVKQLRSSQWRKVRKAFVRANPCCAVCNKHKSVQVHHKQPFHIHPELELEPTNLITLCSKHHLIFGHLGYWRSYNKDVESDCATWRAKYETRP